MESTQQPIERKVTVWTPGSNGIISFNTTATTFGEIREELKKYISLERLEYKQNRFIEGNSQISFEGDEAPLPTNISTSKGITNDLAIILTPSKNVKSGIKSLNLQARRTAACAKIKVLREADPDFREISKDYQRKSADYLEDLINNYENIQTPIESNEKDPKTIIGTALTQLRNVVSLLENLDLVLEVKPIVETTEDIIAEFEKMYKKFK